MKIEKFIPNEFASNNYILYNPKTRNAVIFDPSLCFIETNNFIKKNNLNLNYIIITHAHFDHLYDVKKFQGEYNVKTLFPKEDKILYDNLLLQSQLFGTKPVEPFKIDEYIDENSKIFLDDKEIKVIHTPGHTKGANCYLIDNFLISGDTLFFEEIGRCDLPTGSFDDIQNSIKNKLFKLNDEIKVYTGHGCDTTIGHEKTYNAYFGEKQDIRRLNGY